MASRKYCNDCDRHVLAEYSYSSYGTTLAALAVLSCGLLLPIVCIAMMFAPKPGYVCPKCLERI